jgi:hypothetical protein
VIGSCQALRFYLRALFFLMVAVGVFSATANGQGSCSNPVTGTVTCTGGSGAHVVDTDNDTNLTFPVPVVKADNFPTTIDVTGGGAAVKSVSITLNGYTSVFADASASNYYSSLEMGLLLVSPSGRNLEILRCPGDYQAQSDITVTLADGGTAIPNCLGGSGSTGWTTSGTYAPASYPDGTENEPDYASVISDFNNSNLNAAQTNGTAGHDTLTQVFGGDSVNGDWSLYLVSDAEAETDVKFTSWSITITYSSASTSSTTSLSPSVTTAFTSGPNSSVTLTATVTSGATGTVLFQNGATTLACSEGAQPRPLSGASAQCTTTFSSEGLQSLLATYSGDSTYVGSSGTVNVFTYNHATNTGTTYCNTGTISSPGLVEVLPYPSVIDVGDGVNTSLGSDSVSTVSVKLNSFSSSAATEFQMLLVSPDGGHAFQFWGDAGGGTQTGPSTVTLQDGSPSIPDSGFSSGPYSPTVYFPGYVFTLGNPIEAPAPQPPTSYSVPEPSGSATFETSFAGATANGKWLLFVDNESSGSPEAGTASMGGWCIDITPATGHPTTVSLTSTPYPSATKGTSVQFKATVSSSPAVGSTGQVAFSENGSPLAGAPNGGIATVSGGVAAISTSGLPEGDHTITATYTDSTETFNENFGTVTIRVDAATPTPTLNGSTWSYCNTSGITIPAGTVGVNDIGPAAPNPSNIFVTNLPGTVASVSVVLKGLQLYDGGNILESLLVGPNGANAPTSAQTLDFFSLIGNAVGFGPETPPRRSRMAPPL